jgi:vancomycin resistance protein YoaR
VFGSTLRLALGLVDRNTLKVTSPVLAPEPARAPHEAGRLARFALAVPGSSWVWVALALVSGALGGGLMLQSLSNMTPDAEALPQAIVLGKPLELDSKALKRSLERVRAHTSGVFSLRLPEGEPEKVSFGELGVEIDKAHLTQLLKDSVDATSPLSRWRRRQGLGAETPIELPAPLELDIERALPLLLRIKDEFDRPSKDARLNLAERKVEPSIDGLVLDVDQSLLQIQKALIAGASESDLAFERVVPARRTEQLSNVRFDHVIAGFETPYDRALKAEARTYNLRQAASRLDGYVLLPGEVFDFNRTVGPRDEANGYKVAPVIAQGELVDGVGGGTCQISGTLHGAAFFAGLTMVERYPHTRPSSYIKLGLDATVVYPTINFRFKNPFDFPVVLHQTVKDGMVRAEILGPQTDQTVTLIRRIKSALPYEQMERPDARVPQGQRILFQRGVAGFQLEMYRILRKGPHAEREVWEATYPPTTQIVLVGEGPKDRPSRLSDDAHPEYTADELLIATLERSADGAEPKLDERREPGRFGTPGWTKEAGMPVYEP